MASDCDRMRLTSLPQYQEHVPGRVVLASSGDAWPDLQLRSYALPAAQRAAPAPALPQHTLTFVYAGAIQGARRVAGGSWQSFDTHATGHVTVRPAGCCTTLRWTARRPVHTLSLYLAPQRLEEVAMQMGVAPSRVELPDRFNETDPVLHQMARRLRTVAAKREAEEPLFLQTATQMLSVRLLRRHSLTEIGERGEAGCLSYSRLHRVKRYVRAHLGAELSLDDLAQEVGLSKYHFARRFKRRTGQSPYQFVIYERVREARQRLRETTRPLAQIALDVGFSSQSHFSRTFKRHTGTTPGTYRAAWDT